MIDIDDIFTYTINDAKDYCKTRQLCWEVDTLGNKMNICPFISEDFISCVIDKVEEIIGDRYYEN